MLLTDPCHPGEAGSLSQPPPSPPWGWRLWALLLLGPSQGLQLDSGMAVQRNSTPTPTPTPRSPSSVLWQEGERGAL